MRNHSAVREGIAAGIIGATCVAVWFLGVDLLAGRPFYTPETLGASVLSFFGPPGAEGAAVHIAIYTLFHYAAFCVVGVLVTAIVHAADRSPPVLVGLLILVVAFELGFYGLTALLAQSPRYQPIAWYQIFVANLIAAAAMGTYLWKTHPGIAHELDVVLKGGE